MGALDDARDRARLLDTAPVVDRTLIAPMTLVSVSTDALSAVVQDLGGGQVTVACNPSAVWTGVQVAMVIRDPTDGRAIMALCPGSKASDATSDPGPTPDPSVTRRTATITPVSTGTYWPNGGGWGRFNSGRYGGVSDLYQYGQGIGVGSLRGVAFYGDRVRALGASSIVSASVHLMGNGSMRGGWSPALQATTQKAQPAGDVSLTGGTYTGSVSGVGETDVGVTAAVELMRTGAAGGLALVGTTYGGLYGTSRGRAMALSVTYEVTS